MDEWQRRCLLLEEEVKELKQQLAYAYGQIQSLLLIIETLQKENKELREKLNTSSKNSSQPPSQNSNQKATVKTPTGKKQGAQPNHRPAFRKLEPPENVDRMVDVFPSQCSCGYNSFDQADIIKTETLQQIDIPPIKAITTQYNVHTCCCQRCKERSKAKYPIELNWGAFGVNLRVFTTGLFATTNTTYRQSLNFLSLFAVPISLGSLASVRKFAANSLKDAYNQIKASVLKSKSVNGDETTWKLKGKRQYVWIVTNPQAVFLQIDSHRGQEAFQKVYGHYSNTLTTDRYEVYRQHKGPHQLCHAHIRRDFVKISEREGEDQSLGLELLKLSDRLFHIHHQYRHGVLDRLDYVHKIEEDVMPSMHTWLILGTHSNRYGNKTKGTCKRLLRDWSYLWTFLYIPDVEPTNNLAERDLRPIVIRRKISFGSQSLMGNLFVERICSIWQTLKKNCKNIWSYLKEAFNYYIRGDPIPYPL